MWTIEIDQCNIFSSSMFNRCGSLNVSLLNILSPLNESKCNTETLKMVLVLNILRIVVLYQQVAMDVDIGAVGEQLRIFQDQYKEKSKEYDRLYETFNQTSQVQQHHLNINLINTFEVILTKTPPLGLSFWMLWHNRLKTVKVKICLLVSRNCRASR